MSVWALCGAGLCAAFSVVLLRELKKEAAAAVLLGFTVLSLTFVLPVIRDTAGLMGELLRADEGELLTVLFKALGSVLLTGTAADLCRSVGELSLASSLELCGKAELLALSLPLFSDLLGLLPL